MKRTSPSPVLFAVVVDLLLAVHLAGAAAVTWNVAAGGTWDTTSLNWLPNPPGTYGDATPDSALFDDTVTGPDIPITVQAGGVSPAGVTVAGANNYALQGGAIGGSGALSKSGTGTLTLLADNTFTGGVTLSGGTIAVGVKGNETKLGAATGTLHFTGNSTLQGTVNGTSFTRPFLIDSGVTASVYSSLLAGNSVNVLGKVSGQGTLKFSGTSWFQLNNAANDWSGGLDLSGTVTVHNDGSFGAAGNPITLNTGGSLRSTTFSTSRNITINGGQFNPDGQTLTWNGVISGTALRQAGNGGTLVLTNPANSFDGVKFEGSGPTLVFGADAHLGVGGITRANVGDPTLRIVGTTPGTFTKAVAVGTGTGSLRFEVAESTATATWNGVISGTSTTVAVAKRGPGRLILANDNTYLGPTNVNAGTLLVNGTTASQRAYTVADGATLGGTGSIGLAAGSAFTAVSGATVAPGQSVGTLTVGGSLVLDAGSTLAIEIEGLGTGQYDRLVVAGAANTVTLGDGALLALDIASGLPPAAVGAALYILDNQTSSAVLGAFQYDEGDLVGVFAGKRWQITYRADTGAGISGGNDIALVAIPEPSLAALLLAMAPLVVRRRARR